MAWESVVEYGTSPRQGQLDRIPGLHDLTEYSDNRYELDRWGGVSTFRTCFLHQRILEMLIHRVWRIAKKNLPVAPSWHLSI